MVSENLPRVVIAAIRDAVLTTMDYDVSNVDFFRVLKSMCEAHMPGPWPWDEDCAAARERDEARQEVK